MAQAVCLCHTAQKGQVKFPQVRAHMLERTHNTQQPSVSQGLTPPGWLEAFVSAGQRLSQLRWCHRRLSHGSKPLSSRTTTKKSLCSIEPTRTGENEACFRSFLFQYVTFSLDFLLSLCPPVLSLFCLYLNSLLSLYTLSSSPLCLVFLSHLCSLLFIHSWLWLYKSISLSPSHYETLLLLLICRLAPPAPSLPHSPPIPIVPFIPWNCWPLVSAKVWSTEAKLTCYKGHFHEVCLGQ